MNYSIDDFTFKNFRLIEAVPLFSGSFAYIDNAYKARLESTLLPWKPFHQSVGLRLRFQYLLPTKSESNLKVFLRETTRDTMVLVWQMLGYHGKEWSAAEVPLRGAEEIQVSEQFRFDQRVILRLVCEQFFQIKVNQTVWLKFKTNYSWTNFRSLSCFVDTL